MQYYYYFLGINTKMGRDHTIYSVSNGWVKFVYDKIKKHQIVTVSSINPNIPKNIRSNINDDSIKLIEIKSGINEMKI